MSHFLLVLALAGASLTQRGVTSGTDSLAAHIRARIAQVPGAEVGVAYRNLGRADTLYIDADTLMHAASTMKVPVMIEVFRQV
ncbi:MAG TPA: serine hydrolase, partial [Gemmatimonadaceae bacterium]|nr:serine hydrolase [Gemmatimonadaceae bacterium]